MRFSKLERMLWRRRTTRMDTVFSSLNDCGPQTAAQLAIKLQMRAADVNELLEDLHVDAIVMRAGDLFFVNDDTYPMMQ